MQEHAHTHKYTAVRAAISSRYMTISPSLFQHLYCCYTHNQLTIYPLNKADKLDYTFHITALAINLDPIRTKGWNSSLDKV